MDDPVERKMQPHRLLASFFLGISVTLLLTSPPALSGVYSVSPGWMGLWLVATVACISLGAMLLLGLPWRELHIDVRRGSGLAYLASAGVNLLALAVLVISLGGQGTAICLPNLRRLGFGLPLPAPLRHASGEERGSLPVNRAQASRELQARGNL